MSQSHQGCASVTIDTRALVDKVLARYSGEFTVFRELLQNSDDAGCDAVEIRFETATFSGRGPEAAIDDALPDSKTPNVVQWIFKNHGKPFRPEDWGRLPKIAEGNPDPQKVGAFGVGFFSVFSVTENPYVSSGEKQMQFLWNDNQLYYTFDDLPQTAAAGLWTTFKLPLREAAPMPPVSAFMQFLASSITFMAHLKDVTVFFNDDRVGQITKSLGDPRDISIPTELERRSPEKNMRVKSVQQYPVTITAGIMLPFRQHDSIRMHETKVVLTVFTAEVDITVEEKLRKELNRCTKKDPPPCLKYSLIYTEKDEYDQSRINEQKHPCEFPSAFRDLCAGLQGATSTRIFIGHATAQTTGIGGHMASNFIPTVERECIDLVDKNIAIWNNDLLYVGGFLCRAVYELELSKIQSSWEEGNAGQPQSRPSRELQDRFLHVLKFFTFHKSTPSPKVAQLLAKSFYGCSTLPLRLVSSVGVRGAPDVRSFDSLCAKFLKSVPMLSEYVTQEGARSIEALPDQYKIRATTPSEVLEDLRRHTLDVEEVVACLRWWITPRQNNTAALLDVITLRGPICLSSIASFIDPEVLGLHIPPDGPLPLSLMPLGISKHFSRVELSSFGWKEFTVASWLQHISRPDVMSADKTYDMTRSVDWAGRVLSTLSHVWPQLSDDVRNKSSKVFRDKPCIPTSKGLSCPESSYIPTADDALFRRLDLPMVSRNSTFEVDDNMKELLLFVGVRRDPPVKFLLDQMLSTGHWTMLDLVDYLVQKEPSLTLEDFSHLEASEIFTREGFPGSEEENARHCVGRLYPPVDIFRTLRLPVIKWNELEWNDISPEAQLLYRLGLNHFPSLPKIVELCSSGDIEVQKTAFMYLCKNLHSQYSDYKPERFHEVEFIPAETKDGTCLKKLGEVYSCAQWKALGFCVVQDQYLKEPLNQLGVTQHPPTSKLLGLLEETPPPDKKTAGHWFDILSDHLASFSPPDLIRLSRLPIVPIGPFSDLKLLPPTKCYLNQDPKPLLYMKLFNFVNFGPKANRFLVACGSKNKISVEDVAQVLIEDPGRFFELAGGYEGFLIELRTLAYQNQHISNDTLHKMSHSSTLLGMRRMKTEDQPGCEYEYRFLTYQGVTIIDDINNYQLFNDHLFVAPREDAIERFYASLGCSYLSTVVKERCNDLHEIQDPETCSQVRSLILYRLPLFIRNTDTKPRVAIPSSPDHLKVKACRRICVSRTLITGNVEQTRDSDVHAIARQEGDSIELWVFSAFKLERDMYEVATSLCRLFFGTNKMNATLLLETILSADPEALERRGFIVDQHGDECSAARKTDSAHSASIIHSRQQSRPDPQPDPQLNREKIPGSPGATSQFPALASSDTSDKVLDTLAEHSTSLPLSRTSCEVIPQNYIRNNVEQAIKACGLEREKFAVQVGESQPLRSSFCRLSADVRNLHHIGTMKNVQIWADEGMPNAGAFMEHMHGPLARFVDIIIPLSEIYRISLTTLRVFYEFSGGCIAFNCQGIIYLNLRYFEVWHDEQVKSGNLQNAQMSWFLTLAHEIAHNLTDLHGSDHEFWFSAICEAHPIVFLQLLRLPNTWLRYVLWLSGIFFVILFAYLTRRISPLINISH